MEISIDGINSFVSPIDPQLQALLATMCQRILALEAEKAANETYIDARLAALDRIEKILSSQNVHIQLLEDKIEALEAELEKTQTYTAIERANDRKRLAELERPGLMPAQKDHREVLRALLVANEGKMLQSQAIKTMRISKSRMSELLALAKDEIGSKPYHLDKRQNLLYLK